MITLLLYCGRQILLGGKFYREANSIGRQILLGGKFCWEANSIGRQIL